MGGGKDALGQQVVVRMCRDVAVIWRGAHERAFE